MVEEQGLVAGHAHSPHLGRGAAIRPMQSASLYVYWKESRANPTVHTVAGPTTVIWCQMSESWWVQRDSDRTIDHVLPV